MRHEPTVFPSLPAEIKATYLLLPNFGSILFIQLQWAEKAKILASNNMKINRKGNE